MPRMMLDSRLGSIDRHSPRSKPNTNSAKRMSLVHNYLPVPGLICRYVSEGNDRKIRENESSAEETKAQIASANDARATIDSTIATIQDELGRSESYRSNINFNILDRGEIKQIKDLKDKIAEIDLDSMAKARKEFNVKYKDKMEEEKKVADDVSPGSSLCLSRSIWRKPERRGRLTPQWSLARGELVQMTQNRKKMQSTMELDYKGIDKQFKEQLIKTKVSHFGLVNSCVKS
jgi:DNA repair protein RAD50